MMTLRESELVIARDYLWLISSGEVGRTTCFICGRVCGECGLRFLGPYCFNIINGSAVGYTKVSKL